MYNLTEYLENSTNNSLTLEQVEKVKKAEQYLQKHKIHEICNELVAKLIESRSQKVKDQMISILKKMKEKQNYFVKADFEAMFDSYDIFDNKGNGQIPYIYLIQALTHINVHYNKEQFLNLYPQFKLEKGVKKSDFVSIMEAQYKKKLQP